jgi:hypothetical protein
LGALSTAGARADLPAQGDRTGLGDLLIRSEGDRIYLSEGGRETELQLNATPQRDRLLQLLRDRGAGGVRLDPDPRLIMSGGGGSGFSLRDIQRSLTNEQSAPRDPPQPASPRRPPASRNTKTSGDKKG